MGQALQLAGKNQLLLTHPELTLQSGPYRYAIRTQNGLSTYSVSDGTRTIQEPIRWAFGLRTQTFVLEHDGRYYESLVSYYDEIDRLDTTIGDQALHPVTLDEAFGRPLASSEVTACFGCHSTNSVHDAKLTLSTMQPGVTCERCHTGAAIHQQTITSRTAPPAQVKAAIPEHLGERSAEGISNFCGQCHRSWDTVVRNNWFGEMNVRFQPYRLATSKCFDGADARSSCVACHNPHENLVKEPKRTTHNAWLVT